MSLFDNPMIQKMFMGKAEQLIKEHGVKAIVITPDENGQLQFKLHKEEIVVYTKEENDKLLKQITNG